MGILISADEVFAIAIQMESNGAAFYRKAAAQHEGRAAECLESLASMEDEHRVTFAALRRAVAAARGPAPESNDLYQEGQLYLSAIADGYRVEGSPRVADSLTGRETVEEVLRIAIDLEKQAILFYLGLKDVVPDPAGRRQVEAIIGEEKKHVVILTDELKSLAGA